ncbi:MAG TPA: hypothetical protein VFU34_06225, partial [Gaiellaceae bacterium]|nr:hypothetical protein [Gaiellaceae bacterium]
MGKVGNLTRLVDVVEPKGWAPRSGGRSLRMVLVGMAVLAVALVAVAISGAAPGTDASVKEFDQCANGAPPSSATGCPENWINGILNANNSHYAEDEVTAQRVILELPKNSPTTGRTVEISFLTRKGGVHAYDSLATWNYTQTSADRCGANLNAAYCVPGPATTFPIPLDPTPVADNNSPPVGLTQDHQLTGQVFTMYGGTITAASAYTHDDPGGSSDSYAHITLTYSVPSTADATNVMLLFGAHIAASTGPRGWGVGVGAGSISGGPYHVRITAADGASVGNRDNQIMSGAILAPANLLIEKVAVGGDATFDYTSTGGLSPASFPITTVGGSGSQSFTNIAAGTYTVTESAPPAGWDFTSLDCVDEDGNSSETGMTSNIVLAAGETATCTYTNTKRGSIVVDKVTAPSGDPQSFPFTLTGGPDSINQGFSLTDAATPHNSGLVKPGTYVAAETTVPPGWDLTGQTCSDGSSPSSISLEAGETVTCTFTNTRRGRIIVEKQTIPNGDPTLFTFTPSYGSSFQLSDGQQNNSGLLVPGNYSVSETVPAGWILSSATCSDGSSPGSIDLGPNEAVTCTFTNTKAGAIVVQKQTDPDGAAQSFAFTASYDADGFSLTDGQSNNSGSLAPGTYSVAETVPAGWDLQSAVCNDGSPANAIVLAAGETVTCVFTNVKDANIVVQKQTNPDGDPQSFAFGASYDANGFSLSDGESNNSGTLLPGTYSVSETVPAGWDLDSAVCSDQSDPSAIQLGPGETVTCVFTNEKDAVIIVEKQTNPNGDPTIFSFTASYDADGFALSDGQSNNSGDLDPGTYSVSETVPAGWNLASAICDDGSAPASIGLAAGETVRCVFTNVKEAFIVVEKQTNPDADPQVFGFSANYDANGFSLSDGQSNNSGALNPGIYSVTENVPAGWDLDSAVCSDQSNPSAISLQAGETVTCVFTNVKNANIIVEKQTDPNAHPQSFEFDASYDANGFALSDGQQNDSGDIDPGTYSVSEIVPAGWDLTPAVCSDGSVANAIHLAAGETVTCVFTNTLRRGHIVVEKQTDPDGDPQVFDFDASYDASGFSLSDGQSNDSGALLPGTYSVSESVPAGWDLESAV